jgi:type I restriction enzyme S subunit
MMHARLGDHAKLIRGITYKPSDVCDYLSQEAVACMRTKNVQQSLDESDLVGVPATLVKSSEKILGEGDILVSSANSWNLVGKCCHVPALSYRATAGGFISILRPSTDHLDSRYLYRWFASDHVQRKLRSFGNKTTNISNLDHKRALGLSIPLPPLPEQKRIAAILDAADALRAKRRESLAQLDAFLQSTFLHMFGDPVTNPMGWEREPMGGIMRIRRGGSPRPIEKYLGGTVNWVKIGDATRSEDDLYITSCAEKITEDGIAKTTLLEPGSFVFANSGVSLGFARILKVRGAIHDGWLAFDKFDPNRIQELFFLKALNSITLHFRRTAPSGTQPNLNTGIMKAFGLILPPIQEQRHFATIVQSVEQQKSRLRAHLAELDALFASLQARAFSGAL